MTMFYADDTQLYFSLDLSDSKTEFLILTSSFIKQHFNDLNINAGNSKIVPSLSARNIW